MLAVVASEPLVPGKSYWVPCVLYPWLNGHVDWWPVLGPRHKDKAFLNFDYHHYHVDGRFLSKRQRTRVGLYSGEGLASVLGRQPLNRLDKGPPPEQPTMRRRKCWMAAIEYPFLGVDKIVKVARHFAHRQCERGDAGWICPHQRTPLGSIKPIDGVITCPLHGLRIDAASGKVLAAADPLIAEAVTPNAERVT